MQPSDMLHQMCSSVLAQTDIKALCKARGLPPQAASSRGILETLFLSPQGVSDVLSGLDRHEIALLHLLKHSGAPVDVAFFSRIYGGHDFYGTFNQRYQKCFANVKQRLVRSGVLLWAEARQGVWEKKSKMELWRFALPSEFNVHLPPLIESPRQFDGDGDWRPNVVLNRLTTDLGRSRKAADDKVFQIEASELLLNGKPFKAAKLMEWQQSCWRQEVRDGKKTGPKDAHSKHPDEAAAIILSALDDGYWADAEELAEPLRVFCGKKVDADSVCQAGWDWGVVAKRRADRKIWYRLAPAQAQVAPQDYLSADGQDGNVTADLTTIPFDALEQVVSVSDQRVAGRSSRLLLKPNSVKLGRADDQLLAAEAVQWLVEHTKPFAEAYVKLGERRGKTILHENVLIARVSDLSLKVAIEKALGSNLVSLKNDFVAFPYDSLDDVQRVVKKSGHVVKEVAAK